VSQRPASIRLSQARLTAAEKPASEPRGPYAPTPTVALLLVAAAGDLLPYHDQAAAAGVSPRTYASWRARAKRGHGRFLDGQNQADELITFDKPFARLAKRLAVTPPVRLLDASTGSPTAASAGP
jgi:hypothetical protein